MFIFYIKIKLKYKLVINLVCLSVKNYLINKKKTINIIK